MPSEHEFKLPDGRRLGYCCFGEPGGEPVFYFHGWPCSRLEARLLHAEAVRRHSEIVAVDRPGYGLSDFQPGRQLLDWPRDIEALADHLNLDHFRVVGVSGGGPYAAACTWALGERIVRAALVSALAPLANRSLLQGMHLGNRSLLRLARVLPQAGRPLLAPFGWSLRRRLPPLLALPFSAGFAAVDREVLKIPEVGSMLYECTAEAFRQGARGPAWEGRIYPRPWGFELSGIEIPVDIWQGGADRNVPAAMAIYLHQNIPGSRLHLHTEEGHISLPYRQRHKILEQLLG